jgi:hypothetical protein
MESISYKSAPDLHNFQFGCNPNQTGRFVANIDDRDRARRTVGELQPLALPLVLWSVFYYRNREYTKYVYMPNLKNPQLRPQLLWLAALEAQAHDVIPTSPSTKPFSMTTSRLLSSVQCNVNNARSNPLGLLLGDTSDFSPARHGPCRDSV